MTRPKPRGPLENGDQPATGARCWSSSDPIDPRVFVTLIPGRTGRGRIRRPSGVKHLEDGADVGEVKLAKRGDRSADEFLNECLTLTHLGHAGGVKSVPKLVNLPGLSGRWNRLWRRLRLLLAKAEQRILLVHPTIVATGPIMTATAERRVGDAHQGVA